MSECNDKRFENMLFAYELNLLDEKEQLEFELHLYKCSSCFEKIERFKKTAHLLNRSLSVRDTLEEIAVTGSAGKDKRVTRKKFWSALVPISIAAVLLIFLILKDWRFEIKPSQEVFAFENRIAIMYFENLSDPVDSLKLGEIVTNLLIADLSESNYLSVVSNQRLSDILGMHGMEGVKNISNHTALQIANEAKAKWILTGNIIQTVPHIIVTTQLVDVRTGDVLISQRIEGDPDDDIFSVIDKLTVQIKNSLNLPSDALLESDPDIADCTTHSPLAYRHYLEGIENYYKIYNDLAQSEFETALKYDSTFAMAYYYLARIKDRNLIYKALEYADSAGTIDRLYIQAFEASITGNIALEEELYIKIIKQYPDEKMAFFHLGIMKHNDGNFQLAIDYLNNAIEIDPRMKIAYNQLAYTYNSIGDFEKALWAIDKYIELAPNEANPLDTKAEIYALNGMLDNAIESYKRALIVKPDYYNSLRSLSLMYMFNRQYSEADSCLNILTSVENIDLRRIAYAYKCDLPILQGKFEEALKTIDDIISISDTNAYQYHFIKSQIYIDRKDWTSALKEIEKTIELHDVYHPEDKVSYRYFRIYILAESGNIERAAELTEKIKTLLEDSGNDMYSYWYAVGTIAMVEGDYDKAITYLEKTLGSRNKFFTRYMMARVYYRAGRFDNAISELELIQNSFGDDRATVAIWSTKLYYLLGLAYEEIGQFAEAAEQYNTFLDIWKNADTGIVEIDDARKRVARLDKL